MASSSISISSAGSRIYGLSKDADAHQD
jgi:hypothetical protein